MAGCGEQKRIENLQVGRLFFFSPKVGCLALQFYSLTQCLPFSPCQRWCRAAVTGRNELTCSTASALLLCHECRKKAQEKVFAVRWLSSASPCPFWCEKSGRKSKPFPSLWPLRIVAPQCEEAGSECGSKTRPVWEVCSAPQRCQAQHRKATGPRQHPQVRMNWRSQRRCSKLHPFLSRNLSCRPLQTREKFASGRNFLRLLTVATTAAAVLAIWRWRLSFLI